MSKIWMVSVAVVGAIAMLVAARPSERIDRKLDGKLQFQIVLKDAAGALEELTDENKETLSDKGFTFTSDEIISHPQPAVGMWLKVGEDYVPVDEDGDFEIPENDKDQTKAELYPQLADEEPSETLDVSDLSEPLVTTIKGGVGTAMQMDGKEEDEHGGKGKTHGPQVPEKCDFMTCDVKDKTKKGCCQDFDGPFAADPKKRLKGTANGQPDDDCKKHRYRALLLSICGNWILKGPCAGEAAVKGALEKEPNLPGCFAMHRGRWCQHLDAKEFAASAVGGAPLRVKTGGKLRIEVLNNTPANSTGIMVGTVGIGGLGGKIELVDTSKGNLVLMALSLYRLDHFKDKANPTPDAVYNKRLVIEYQAPDSLPDGETSATEKLIFVFWGKTVKLEIEVEA